VVNAPLGLMAWEIGGCRPTSKASGFRRATASNWGLDVNKRGHSNIAHTLILSLVLTTVAACSKTHNSDAVVHAAQAGKPCSTEDSTARSAADLARNAFPDSLPDQQRRLGRSNYLSRNRWELFDENHDGRLTFSEYLDSDWATLLASVSNEKCSLSKIDFEYFYLGEPGPERSPSMTESVDKHFDYLDRDKKGYITKGDIETDSLRSFKYEDRSNKGFLLK
jgi:hypothetical protein